VAKESRTGRAGRGMRGGNQNGVRGEKATGLISDWEGGGGGEQKRGGTGEWRHLLFKGRKKSPF